MSALFDTDDTSSGPASDADNEKVLREVVGGMVQTLDNLNKQFGKNDFAELVNEVIQRKKLKASLPKNVPAELIRLLQIYVEKTPVPAMAADVDQLRRMAALTFLQQVLKNEFKTPAKRWGANVANTAMRTGIVVTICIVLREALAFALAKSDALGELESLTYASGIAMLASVLGLNLVGGAADLWSKDKKDKLGSMYSVGMRSGMCLFSLGTLLACYFQGTLDKLITQSSALLTYCYARDLCNFFLKLDNDVSTLPKKGVMGSGVVYGALQFLASFLPDQVAPLAGAAALPKVGQTLAATNATVTLEDIQASGLNLPHTLLKAMFNALADMADDIIAPAIFRAVERPTLLALSEYQRFGEEKYSELEIGIEAFANKLFDMKTDNDRDREIRKYSWALYGILDEHLLAKEDKFKKLSAADRATRQRLQPFLRLDTTDPTNFPPASHLVFGERSLPDFANFKSDLVRLLAAIAKELSSKQGLTIPEKVLAVVARHVYIDAFIDAYMPIRPSTMQAQVRASLMEGDPKLLPNVLRTLLRKQVKKTRDAKDAATNDGLRITLAFNNPLQDANQLRRAFTQFTTTSVSRQNFYIFVFGAVYAIGGYIDEEVGDNPLLASVLQSLLVMGAVIVGYQFFYGVHDRAPSEDGRALTPGGDGARELPMLTTDGELVQAIEEQSRNMQSFMGSASGGDHGSSASPSGSN